MIRRLVSNFGRGRVRLVGGRWPDCVLVEVTPTGMVIEAALEPSLPAGTTTDVTFKGLRGRLVAESSRVEPAAGVAYHTLRVIELDEGLLAAVEAAAGSHRRGVLHVLGPGVHGHEG